MRRCLVPALKTRHRLVLPLEDEALPRSHAGDARYRLVAGGPRTGILLDRHIPPIPGGTDQNGELCFFITEYVEDLMQNLEVFASDINIKENMDLFRRLEMVT
ncbi:hypothetical protein BHE74_00049584 [Ensete ventricosum]|nr:hypothetical protein BHE74_00049584 [Ensete ventricosum]